MQKEGLDAGQSRPQTPRLWGRACLAIALFVASHASAEGLLPADPLAGSCGVSDGRSQAPRQPHQTPEQKPAEPALPPATPPDVGELLHPPREHEIQDLGGVLKAMAAPETSGPTLAGLAEGKPFSLERLAVLLGDVRSIVAGLHARALRQRLARSKGLNAETRQWVDANAGIVEDCGGSRFANRGGPVAYGQAVALVGKHRSQLEPFLFQAAPPEAVPSPAPPSPTPLPKSRKTGR